MSERILLSIIIPVYNTEKYLNECLDSLFDPSVDEDEYEVIVVDDGSTDGSPEILKTYCRHKNFRMITQENSGQALARNAGIKLAEGMYVGFVDSDDYLLPDAVRTLLDFAREADGDIIEFECEMSNESSSRVLTMEQSFGRTPAFGEGKELFAAWNMQNVYFELPWTRIYKRAFLNENSLFFLPIAYEDTEWQPRCFFYAKKIVYHPIVFYHYRRHDGSTTLNAGGSKKCFDFIKLVDKLEIFKKSIEPSQENLDFLSELGDIIADRVETAINLMYKPISQKDRELVYSELKKRRYMLSQATHKKRRRMYNLTRFLPAFMAFRLYKFF